MGIFGSDLFDTESLSDFRDLYQGEVVNLNDNTRNRLASIVSNIITELKTKLVVPAAKSDDIEALEKASTSALDIIPEMFEVEKSLLE